MEQFAKEEVNYRYAADQFTRCGVCKFFQAPSGCRIVAGLIRPVDVCDKFQRAKKSEEANSEPSHGEILRHDVKVGALQDDLKRKKKLKKVMPARQEQDFNDEDDDDCPDELRDDEGRCPRGWRQALQDMRDEMDLNVSEQTDVEDRKGEETMRRRTTEKRYTMVCASCGETMRAPRGYKITEDEDEAVGNTAGLQKVNLDDSEDEDEDEDEEEGSYTNRGKWGMRAEDEQVGDEYERRGRADRSPYFKKDVDDPSYPRGVIKDEDAARKRSTATRGVEAAIREFHEAKRRLWFKGIG